MRYKRSSSTPRLRESRFKMEAAPAALRRVQYIDCLVRAVHELNRCLLCGFPAGRRRGGQHCRHGVPLLPQGTGLAPDVARGTARTVPVLRRTTRRGYSGSPSRRWTSMTWDSHDGLGEVHDHLCLTSAAQAGIETRDRNFEHGLQTPVQHSVQVARRSWSGSLFGSPKGSEAISAGQNASSRCTGCMGVDQRPLPFWFRAREEIMSARTATT
jgi:hypothetical protein